MSKLPLDYIDILEKLLLGFTIKNKRSIKKNNKKIKDISILLAQQGLTPEEISNCFDPNTYYYKKDAEYNSIDDDNDNEDQREVEILNKTEAIPLSEEEKRIVHENPIIMTKNLKRFFNESNELLKNYCLIDKNKWSKVNNNNIHTNESDDVKLLHKKRKTSEAKQ